MIVGVTGGIGSGKSTVARMLAERGAFVVDADEIARTVVQPGSPALHELAQRFGPDIIDEQGCLRRALLAQRAFATTADTMALNAIMHPRIAAEAQRRLAASPATITVYDMPLLVETGQRDLVDVVVVVDVPEEVQISRAAATGRFSPDDVRQRMRAQAERSHRNQQADIVIDNSGSLESLADHVDRLWATLSERTT